jgi:hypothetical protein
MKVRFSRSNRPAFYRGLSGAVLLLFLGFFSLVCQADGLSSFADDFAAAVESRGSVTARVSCRYYTVLGQPLSVEISGVVTFGGYREPYSVMTLRREEMFVDRKVEATMVVASKGALIRMADSGREVFYEEDVAKLGASLIESRLDEVFLLLMYPEIVEELRASKGSVTEDLLGARRVKRVAVDSPVPMLMTLDAETLLPISIERYGDDANGGDLRVVMTFSGAHLVKRRPPEELFEVNRLFDFRREIYDPKGLFALSEAPEFEADMLDGKRFLLSSARGKAVFVCFRKPGELIGFSRNLYLDRMGDVVRARGGVFIDVFPSYSETSAGAGVVYPAAFTCRSDVPARLFGVDLRRTPCIVLVKPDGRVGDVLSGYLPVYSERTLGELVEAWLPQASESEMTN